MSEAIPLLESGGDAGGALPTRGNPDYPLLRRSELRLLQRKIHVYPVSESERRETVEIVMETARSAEHPRDRIVAANTLLAMDAESRAEELHAIEMEERIRALESDAGQAQPAQGVGVTFAGPVQINQQVAGDGGLGAMGEAIANAFRRSADRELPPPAEGK